MKKDSIFFPMLMTFVLAIVLAGGLILLDRIVRPRTPDAETLPVPAVEPAPEPQAIPQRIICMAPNIAETVFALGAGDRVVGVSSYTTYPPEAAEKPAVGALFDPDLERIAALEPDLIIIQQKHDKIEELAKRRNIRVLAVDMEGGVQPILDAIQVLGRELNANARAEELCAQIKASLNAVRQAVAGKPVLSVILCVDRSEGSFKGVYCAGKQSFFTELLEIAGGRNLYADRDKAYIPAGIEDIVRLAPEVVIETRPGKDISEERKREIVNEWHDLPTLPAVKNNRVYILTDPEIALPGPRIGRVAERLAETLHPEIGDGR